MSLPATHHTTPALNLRRILGLRNIAIAGLTLAVIVLSLDMNLPWASLVVIAGVLGLLGFASWLRLKLPRPVTEREFFAHLLVDVFILTGLLYFTGGSTNPFTSLFLLPMTIAAVVLPTRYVWVMAVLTLVCFSALMFFYVPLPDFHGLHSHVDMHVLGMWFGFLLSAVLLCYFIIKMSSTLRERDAVLAKAREELLQSERILALGTLAAGVAHELGTPLSTMAVLVNDLEHEYARAPELGAKLNILRSQIDRCKKILSTMSISAGQARAEQGRDLALDYYIEGILADWQAARPGVRVAYTASGPRPAPRMVTEHTVEQALLNILNNAADASPDNVTVQADWDTERLTLSVCDRGAGLSELATARAGEAFFTTKQPGQGLGLGLFLAHATLRRFGGSVHLYNREGGGVCTQVVLPIAHLTVPS